MRDENDFVELPPYVDFRKDPEPQSDRTWMLGIIAAALFAGLSFYVF